MTRSESDHRPPARSTYELSRPYRNVFDQYLTHEGYVKAEMQIKALEDQYTVRDLARIFITNTHGEPGRLIFAAATLIHGINPKKLDPEYAEIDDFLRATFDYSRNPNYARYLFDLANETDILNMEWIIKDINLANRYLGEYPIRHIGAPLEYADLLRLETDLAARERLRLEIARVK